MHTWMDQSKGGSMEICRRIQVRANLWKKVTGGRHTYCKLKGKVLSSGVIPDTCLCNRETIAMTEKKKQGKVKVYENNWVRITG